jgi:UDP-N-acetyl-D-glucosamine dehydrogenase
MTDAPTQSKSPRSTGLLEAFQSKVEAKSAQVGVVGLGYVGLPLALLFAAKGFRVTGFDTDRAKIEKLLKGETYIRHVPAETVSSHLREGRLRVTHRFESLKELDAVLICVPTPLDDHREPDLSFVRSTAETIGQNLRSGQLVVLESTTYPGTTDEVVRPLLERSGLRCPVQSYRTDGKSVQYSETGEPDFFLAFSPEREDPANARFQTHQIPKVVGGVNGPSTQAAGVLYSHVFDQTVLVSSSKAAEMAKLLENIFRCVNIALANELKLLCLRMNVDVWEVIEAAKTKPFGFMAFYPGPGLGGHCIPIDPFYLTWKAREYDFPTRFIELAGEINAAMPEHVVGAVSDALNAQKQCLHGSRILILGVAYKKDVDDLRESPALRIMELLQARGARVDYHDPYVPRLPKMRRYDFGLASVELTPQTLAQYHAAVITTDHSCFDYNMIVRHARLVVDTRNATHNVTENRDKIARC